MSAATPETTLDVLVQPRASREKLGPMHGGRLKIAVTAPPVDGEANAAVIALVAKHLGVARSAVEVVAGASSRRKTLRIRGAAAAALAALAALSLVGLGACGGTEGTVTLGLTTAPGSTLLDSVQSMRVTITSPREVRTLQRTASGFDLSLDLDASGDAGAVIVEGFAADGERIACGQSPPFPIAAIDASVVIYMAPPLSLAFAPVPLDTARANVAIAALPYGAVVAGGATGGVDVPLAASDSIAIYNAYNHTLVAGLPMPEPRSAPALATASGGIALVYGGDTYADDVATPHGQFWRFDTTVAPNGAWSTISSDETYARSGAAMLAVGTSDYLLTGMPPLETTGAAPAPRAGATAAANNAAVVTASDGVVTALFVDTAIVRYRNGVFDTLATVPPAGSVVAALPDGRFVLVGGAATDAIVIDAATGAATTVPGALSVARTTPAVGATSRYVVVASGVRPDFGQTLDTADILDAATLALVATVPAFPRRSARAIALPSDQLLLVGGDAATATLELFTPDPPPL